MSKVFYQPETYDIPDEYLKLSPEEIQCLLREAEEDLYRNGYKPPYKPSSKDAHLSCYDRMLASMARATAENE